MMADNLLIDLRTDKRRLFYANSFGNLQRLFQPDDTVSTTLLDNLPQSIDLLLDIPALDLEFTLGVAPHFLHRALSRQVNVLLGPFCGLIGITPVKHDGIPLRQFLCRLIDAHVVGECPIEPIYRTCSFL